MTKLIQSVAVFALTATTCTSFTPSTMGRPLHHTATFIAETRRTHLAPMFMSTEIMPPETQQELRIIDAEIVSKKTTFETKNTSSNSKKSPTRKPAHGKEGVLSPVVLFAKAAIGDNAKFNKLRAQVISMHADVIAAFVRSSETPIGKAVLKAFFELADTNHDGTIEERELAQAFQLLGFGWLKEKQVHGIFERADKDHNGNLSFQEWLSEAPKTLRTNLIKLAKKNGSEMGLLV